MESNLKTAEMKAARENNKTYDEYMTPGVLNHWFDLPRPTRALMVAASRVENTTANILNYDQQKEREREREILRNMRGGGKGKR